MEDQEWTACNCDVCVDMCERRPCWGTPEEIENLIALGYGDRMMLDYWVDYPKDIQIVGPAIIRSEGKGAPSWPIGPCTFLKDGLCELHDTGFKPMEGRLAMCNETQLSLHEKVAMTWDTDKGIDIVIAWNKLMMESE